MSDRVLGEAPTAPGEGECCGNGCEQCVWVVYRAAVEAYRQTQAATSVSFQSGAVEDEKGLYV